MPKEPPIKVTFLFKDDEHFHRFLESNNIDVYTYNWKKREYLVDLSQDIKSSIQDATPSSESQQQPSASPVSEYL